MLSSVELSFDSDASASSRYETLARIGRGGMAEVLLAASRANGVVKLSVLKCLWPELAEDSDFVEMFLDEARLCARLGHPNVVQTHDVVQHEGRLALAMEYLEGQTLTSVLGRLGGASAFSLGARLRIVTNVLAGLEYAHTLTDFDGAPLEVVHRDVSPHNVMVTYDGHVKLLDFGVAKTLAASHQTRPGGVKGKLAYLAPEAIRGDGVDRRADVFSVGVMLWEILAGRRLWGRRSEGVSGAWRLAGGEPAPALPADLRLPRALHLITTRALALDPAARFQTAAELGAALESVGVDASLSQARALGRLVSETFAAERAQRRALVEFHLRPPSAEPGATVDYECLEVSELGATSPREPRGSRATGAATPRPTPPSPPPTPSPASTSTESFVAVSPMRQRRRVGPTLVGAAALATVALGAGAYLGRLGAATSRLTTSTAPSALAAAPPVHLEQPPLAAFDKTPGAETPPDGRAANRERHEHHAHRARLDLISDDVLRLDGEPLASSGAARSLHD